MYNTIKKLNNSRNFLYNKKRIDLNKRKNNNNKIKLTENERIKLR